MPAMWQRTLDYVHSVRRAVTIAEVQTALGLAQTPRLVLNRMVTKGLLLRVSPGVYQVAG
jgi:predicted transcriptional regulator of viral defense system